MEVYIDVYNHGRYLIPIEEKNNSEKNSGIVFAIIMPELYSHVEFSSEISRLTCPWIPWDMSLCGLDFIVLHFVFDRS